MPPDPKPLPPNLVDTVGDTATLTNDLIGRAASNLGDLAARWIDGLTENDVNIVTKKIGADFNEFWVKVYVTASDNVTPGPH
ncbi:MAG: hypothetical protein HYZ39_25150 [Mycolicibacterium cosmeticum]|nr:hypothetical protein [Mycolicibacterium cosmeticum]